MNNKGQSLVLFILLIPLLICLFALIFDSALIVVENNKLKNTTATAIKYLVSDNKNIELVKEYILKNDKNIEIIKITNTEVHLKRYISSYFGNAIGYKNYELETFYYGVIENGNLRIKRKG